ncbi:phosphotransferase [Marinitenerispora sediminis]|uniref:Phosphotransferase n=1 Tax=Marinitenerispora sediminis TaxID=1931232 RepID=A0A368TBW6_9ACTN|nr:phosphotransferase [Marinitenerispora sediminis]RCV58007.1 phosphotransferase [Marinitenerispora sediminis]RCV62602.1 phosphotransferase [Marinitenerispora sediminis]
MRVTTSPRPGGKLWEGPFLADALLDDEAIPRPLLLAEATWGDGPTHQALLWQRTRCASVSTTPDLDHAPSLGPRWWDDLASALARLRATPPPAGRQAVRQEYINRIGRFLPDVDGAGIDLTVQRWETAHGDLHWANLTAPRLQLLDWEGWGAAPAGWDAAVLHAYSLTQPEVARQVRDVFTDKLNTPDGRLAHLVIVAQIIQASERDEIHARLAPFVRDFAAGIVEAASQ